MSLVSSNPTDPAVRLLAERLWKEYDSEFNAGHLSWRDFEGEARQHVEALREAGHMVTPQASSAEHSDTERLVDIVAEALRERPFHFGPNTRESIVRGMDKVWLTGNERRDLARMAVDAHEEVARRADL